MTIEHANLSGNQLHEPKGVSGASAGTYYLADGASGGSWSVIYATAEDTSISSQANVEITGLSGYSDIVVVLERVAYDASGDLDLTVGNAGGYTADYSWVLKYNTTETVNGSDTTIPINVDSGSGTYYSSCAIRISNFNKDKYSLFDWVATTSTTADITGTTFASIGLARVNEEDAYDRLKITPTTGTLTGTAVRVFGLKGTSDA